MKRIPARCYPCKIEGLKNEARVLGRYADGYVRKVCRKHADKLQYTYCDDCGGKVDVGRSRCSECSR